MIPDSLTIIEKYTFSGCTSLSTMVIPKSVRTIEDGAFYKCDNLREIYYSGSREDWEKVNKDQGHKNFPDDARINLDDEILHIWH